MKTTQIAFGLLLVATSATPLHAQVSAFTYQGRLNLNGAPANGHYDFMFRLLNDPTNGVAAPVIPINIAVPVTNGLFSTGMDFGAENFDGVNRWLEINVRTNGGGPFTTLSPRQLLTPTPYAIAAHTASNLLGTLSVNQLSGTILNASLPASPSFSGTVTASSFSGNGAGLTNLNSTTLGGMSSSNFWRTTGNAGTVTGTHFLGTTDQQPLEFKVNGLRALRLENGGDSSSDLDATPDGAPNIIGGSPRNFVAAGVVGAVIGGGGATNHYGVPYTNSVLADFGTVGGGFGNRAQGNLATIAGGYQNVAEAAATVGGGGHNVAQAESATVAGGDANLAAGTASTVSGGVDNGASGLFSAIGGGQGNSVTGIRSVIGGGHRNTASYGEAVTIAGGRYNEAGAYSATIGGGSENTVNGDYSTVAGGHFNLAGGNYAAIGGGLGNGGGAYAIIPGGRGNNASDYGFAAGTRATADHGAFVWGDSTDADIASTNANSVTMRASGGYRLFTDSTATAGAFLAAGSGSWTSMSDRNAKENFAPVDSQTVLAKVASLPVQTWKYKSQDVAVRHIGPTAQDFKAAFGVGESSTGISSVDADGVALAAIQGLNQKLEETRAENVELKQRLADLERAVQRLSVGAPVSDPAR